jgi:predicted transcriptional regulator/transcriptional regulator with XRE-family HTH domain
MTKTLIGPKLRALRLAHRQTQADMARVLGISPAYVNLLESNQRSLSVKMLMAISEAYSVDWRELTKDDTARLLAELRNVFTDPTFSGDRPDLQELRGAVDHAPRFVDRFLDLYSTHRKALDILMKISGREQTDEIMRASPEAVIHDFFRDHSNHFPLLEDAAEAAREETGVAPETLFGDLRGALMALHGIKVVVRPIDQMGDALRVYDEKNATVMLSQALNSENRAFQLAHVLAMVRLPDIIDRIADESGIRQALTLSRLRVELANYFAAAFMMPYQPFLESAASTGYDLDRMAAAFGVSFEQVCQRLTTLQREGARGIPFFFLRVDRAGNVTKRFNSTSFNLAEYGGSCPVWNIHTAFYTPGVIMPQFVEMPEGERFFTISRTVHRPVFSEETQDRRLTIALGCAAEHAPQIRYASSYNFSDPKLYSPVGINCQLCPRQACSQRAHQPLFIDLPIDANRRGSTRYES